MKFGLLVEIDTLKRETSPNQKPKVKFRRSGRQLENRYNVIIRPEQSDLDEIWQPGADMA